MDIKKVLIVGSGTLGQQIGFQCATHGFETTMYDFREESLDASREGRVAVPGIAGTYRSPSNERR